VIGKTSLEERIDHTLATIRKSNNGVTLRVLRASEIAAILLVNQVIRQRMILVTANISSSRGEVAFVTQLAKAADAARAGLKDN
jgi:hypothetical protein